MSDACDPSGEHAQPIAIRTTLRPGDLGAVVQLHGLLYAQEYGFDITFEAYVAGPLSEFAGTVSERERLWIAERNDRMVGCIAVVAAAPTIAQLRWFLVDPGVRGAGLGARLLREAVAFCKSQKYDAIVLWTVSALTSAAHLYRKAGFVRVEEKPARRWGVDVVEEKYELALS